MGAWLQNNYIHITNKSGTPSRFVRNVSYNEITSDFVEKVAIDERITHVQISEALPRAAYQIIDDILAARPDMTFRIFGLYGYSSFDIEFLHDMPHLRHLAIDCHLRKSPNMIDFTLIKGLKLQSLILAAFDLRDYSFLKELSGEIEVLGVMADTSVGSIEFDCQWLLAYSQLKELWLGKKANKNLSCVADMRNLRSLTLRGIKIRDFSFFKEMNLERIALLWNGNDDLHELSALKSLKEIELWRINGLKDISFLSSLEKLEIIKLQDLKHVSKLPDLSGLRNIKEIIIDHTGIDDRDIDDRLRPFVTFCR